MINRYCQPSLLTNSTRTNCNFYSRRLFVFKHSFWFRYFVRYRLSVIRGSNYGIAKHNRPAPSPDFIWLRKNVIGTIYVYNKTNKLVCFFLKEQSYLLQPVWFNCEPFIQGLKPCEDFLLLERDASFHNLGIKKWFKKQLFWEGENSRQNFFWSKCGIYAP